MSPGSWSGRNGRFCRARRTCRSWESEGGGLPAVFSGEKRGVGGGLLRGGGTEPTFPPLPAHGPSAGDEHPRHVGCDALGMPDSCDMLFHGR